MAVLLLFLTLAGLQLSSGSGLYDPCEPGFREDGPDGCIDIDECSGNIPFKCIGYMEYCVNTPGSYECRCRQGFVENSSGRCVDVNECYEDGYGYSPKHLCAENENCVNLVGTYSCTCKLGYLPSAKKGCFKPDILNLSHRGRGYQ